MALGFWPQEAEAPQLSPVKIRVTRQDLAEVLQEVDAAFQQGQRLPATVGRSPLAETNLAFDAITKTFFSLQLVRALEGLVKLRTGLLGPDARSFPSCVREFDVDGVWVRHWVCWRSAPEPLSRVRTRSGRYVSG